MSARRGRAGGRIDPVTHRDVADTAVIASGRSAAGDEPDYAALVATRGTIVLFMSLGRLRRVAEGLVGAGLPASTPAAVVSNGTLPEQQTVTSTLAGIAVDAEDLLSRPRRRR